MSQFKRRPVNITRVSEVQTATQDIPTNAEQVIALKSGPAPDSPQKHESAPTPPNDQNSIPVAVHAGTDGQYIIGGVYDVPIKRIASNPYNPRVLYPQIDIDRMAVMLEESGQRISATGYLDADGTVVLIEGETRLRASRQLHKESLRVEIRDRPSSQQALYEEARSANVDRRNQTPLDDAVLWKRLVNEKVYANNRALATALKVPEDQISRTLSLSKLSPRVFHAIAEYPDLLTLRMLTAIREYWEVTNDDDTIELISLVSKNGLGSREVTAMRISVGKEAARRPRSLKEPIQFKGAMGELKSFEEGGRLEFKLKGLTPEVTTELTKKIKELLGAS